MAAGWIKLHRKMLDSAVMRDEFLCRLWIWCLLKAGHIDREDPGRGMVRAGEFITGRFIGAEELKVSPSKFDRGLKTLSKLGQITRKPNNRNTVVSVLNWAIYQGFDDDSEQRMNNRRTTDEQPVNTLQELKNERREETPSGDLLQLWFFHHRYGKPVGTQEVAAMLADLCAAGFTDAELEAEIKANGRGGEFPSEFSRRLMAGRTKPKKPASKETFADAFARTKEHHAENT
jgi:hypothetical protein